MDAESARTALRSAADRSSAATDLLRVCLSELGRGQVDWALLAELAQASRPNSVHVRPSVLKSAVVDPQAAMPFLRLLTSQFPLTFRPAVEALGTFIVDCGAVAGKEDALLWATQRLREALTGSRKAVEVIVVRREVFQALLEVASMSEKAFVEVAVLLCEALVSVNLVEQLARINKKRHRNVDKDMEQIEEQIGEAMRNCDLQKAALRLIPELLEAFVNVTMNMQEEQTFVLRFKFFAEMGKLAMSGNTEMNFEAFYRCCAIAAKYRMYHRNRDVDRNQLAIINGFMEKCKNEPFEISALGIKGIINLEYLVVEAHLPEILLLAFRAAENGPLLGIAAETMSEIVQTFLTLNQVQILLESYIKALSSNNAFKIDCVSYFSLDSICGNGPTNSWALRIPISQVPSIFTLLKEYFTRVVLQNKESNFGLVCALCQLFREFIHGVECTEWLVPRIVDDASWLFSECCQFIQNRFTVDNIAIIPPLILLNSLFFLMGVLRSWQHNTDVEDDELCILLPQLPFVELFINVLNAKEILDDSRLFCIKGMLDFFFGCGSLHLSQKLSLANLHMNFNTICSCLPSDKQIGDSMASCSDTSLLGQSTKYFWMLLVNNFQKLSTLFEQDDLDHIVELCLFPHDSQCSYHESTSFLFNSSWFYEFDFIHERAGIIIERLLNSLSDSAFILKFFHHISGFQWRCSSESQKAPVFRAMLSVAERNSGELVHFVGPLLRFAESSLINPFHAGLSDTHIRRLILDPLRTAENSNNLWALWKSLIELFIASPLQEEFHRLYISVEQFLKEQMTPKFFITFCRTTLDGIARLALNQQMMVYVKEIIRVMKEAELGFSSGEFSGSTNYLSYLSSIHCIDPASAISEIDLILRGVEHVLQNLKGACEEDIDLGMDFLNKLCSSSLAKSLSTESCVVIFQSALALLSSKSDVARSILKGISLNCSSSSFEVLFSKLMNTLETSNSVDTEASLAYLLELLGVIYQLPDDGRKVLMRHGYSISLAIGQILKYSSSKNRLSFELSLILQGLQESVLTSDPTEREISPMVVDTLSFMLSFHANQLYAVLHSFLHVVQNVFSCVCSKLSSTGHQNSLLVVKVSRLFEEMSKESHRNFIGKYIPFVLVDLVVIIESQSILLQHRKPLQSSLFHLMDSCSKGDFQRVFCGLRSDGLRVVFKKLHQDYLKLHRYTGFV